MRREAISGILKAVKRDTQQILRLLEENRERIRGFGVRRIGLFGSYARNEATESSDLDFVVELEEKTFDAYMDLKAFLEDLFQCGVDLVLADAVRPALRAEIVDAAVYAPGL